MQQRIEVGAGAVRLRDSEEDIVMRLRPARRLHSQAGAAPGIAGARECVAQARLPAAGQKHSFPPFEIDTQRAEIRRDGVLIELTPKEYDLAVVLFRNMGRLMSRGHLREAVWGQSGDLATRTVDTHVSQVRKKLDLRPETGFRVVPVYNYGYRLEQIEPSSC
jgi:DNA-binding response OmpR family regulator